MMYIKRRLQMRCGKQIKSRRILSTSFPYVAVSQTMRIQAVEIDMDGTQHLPRRYAE
jgi:hypothetical protein